MGVNRIFEELGYTLPTENSRVNVQENNHRKRSKPIEEAYSTLCWTDDCRDRKMSWWNAVVFKDIR